jgi:5'-nucleotidase
VWINEWESFAHRGDSQFFWMAGEYKNTDPENENSDNWALENGYVAITPTLVDMTARELMNDLKSWF